MASEHYESPLTATEYRERFSKSLARRLSNHLEMRMVRRALAHAGASTRMLDVPCGTGRLVDALRSTTQSLTCVDAARAMLNEARQVVADSRDGGIARVRFTQASAFDLPFSDRAFEVTVCWRLVQHFSEAADRGRLLLELRRVTTRAIVMSFSDAGTARAKRLRGRPNRPGGRVAIARDELAAEIEACGLVPKRFYRLFGAFSVVGAVLIAVP